MLTNRRIATNPWCIGVFLPMCLLAVACGGKDDHDRPIGDSDTVRKGTALEACDAESALEAYDLILDGRFSDWKGNRDKSPKPVDGPRAIYNCPKDSTYDCCFYDGPGNTWPLDTSVWSELEKVQIPKEKELQRSDKYRCVAEPFVPEATNISAPLGGSLSTDPVDLPIACKKDQSPSKALHIRAARLTDWGAEVNIDFTQVGQVGKKPVNASAYDGVAFWVRKGQGGTQTVGNTLFFALTDNFTKENRNKFKLESDPRTGEPLLTPNANGDPTPEYERDAEGNMIPVYGADGAQAMNCYDVPIDAEKCDRFGAGVGLEDEWHFVKIPFSKMRQRGFGVKSPAGRPLYEEIMAISIYLDIGNWDLWIYNVGWYKDPPSKK